VTHNATPILGARRLSLSPTRLRRILTDNKDVVTGDSDASVDTETSSSSEKEINAGDEIDSDTASESDSKTEMESDSEIEDVYPTGEDEKDDSASCSPDCDARVTHVATGDGFQCASFSNSVVKCWGSNRYGELGRDAGQEDRGDTPAPGDTFCRSFGLCWSLAAQHLFFGVSEA
jgi:hypothetical protein